LQQYGSAGHIGGVNGGFGGELLKNIERSHGIAFFSGLGKEFFQGW
jgi:hypothetical protein